MGRGRPVPSAVLASPPPREVRPATLHRPLRRGGTGDQPAGGGERPQAGAPHPTPRGPTPVHRPDVPRWGSHPRPCSVCLAAPMGEARSLPGGRASALSRAVLRLAGRRQWEPGTDTPTCGRPSARGRESSGAPKGSSSPREHPPVRESRASGYAGPTAPWTPTPTSASSSPAAPRMGGGQQPTDLRTGQAGEGPADPAGPPAARSAAPPEPPHAVAPAPLPIARLPAPPGAAQTRRRAAAVAARRRGCCASSHQPGNTTRDLTARTA